MDLNVNDIHWLAKSEIPNESVPEGREEAEHIEEMLSKQRPDITVYQDEKLQGALSLLARELPDDVKTEIRDLVGLLRGDLWEIVRWEKQEVARAVIEMMRGGIEDTQTRIVEKRVGFLDQEMLRSMSSGGQTDEEKSYEHGIRKILAHRLDAINEALRKMGGSE